MAMIVTEIYAKNFTAVLNEKPVTRRGFKARKKVVFYTTFYALFCKLFSPMRLLQASQLFCDCPA
jgi:hypothetical protein